MVGDNLIGRLSPRKEDLDKFEEVIDQAMLQMAPVAGSYTRFIKVEVSPITFGREIKTIANVRGDENKIPLSNIVTSLALMNHVDESYQYRIDKIKYELKLHKHLEHPELVITIDNKFDVYCIPAGEFGSIFNEKIVEQVEGLMYHADKDGLTRK